MDFTTPKQFVCKRSDTIEGESSYAINENVAGKSLGQLPDEMVFLFETDFGKDRGGRGELLKNRTWYRTFPAGDPNRKVYKNRWNQAGGPEILTTQHHEDQGCNVAFISTRVAFVKTADLSKLRWTTDPNDEDRFYKTHFYGGRMRELANALMKYANNDALGRLPPAESWCDLLIASGYCTFWSFFYEESDTVVGESDFAINKNLAGRSLSGIAPNVVLLFETDFGTYPNGRDDLLQNRACYEAFVPRNEAFCKKYGSQKVYNDRWNQAGGPEILATKRYDGRGCLVVFADTSVRFVEAADLPKLKWKPESQE